jgi:hypothetical protein
MAIDAIGPAAAQWLQLPVSGNDSHGAGELRLRRMPDGWRRAWRMPACAAACTRRPARANCAASHGSSPRGPLSREPGHRRARRGRRVCRGEADCDPAPRVTSGMSAIRTHVRARCEEQAKLEHTFAALRSGLP